MKLKNITDEATRKSFGQELALDANGVLDNLVDSVLDGLVDQVPEHEAGEVCVLPRYQLVVEVEDGHPASLFQDPVALLELIHWSTHSLYLLHDWRDGLYGIEELVPLLPVLDGVNVEALHLTEDVLHHYLEAVEASCLWNIDLYNHNVTNDDILNHSKFTFKHFPVFLV